MIDHQVNFTELEITTDDLGSPISMGFSDLMPEKICVSDFSTPCGEYEHARFTSSEWKFPVDEVTFFNRKYIAEYKTSKWVGGCDKTCRWIAANDAATQYWKDVESLLPPNWRHKFWEKAGVFDDDVRMINIRIEEKK